MSEIAMPDELVLSSILTLLSMKDVARSSVVSHTWLRYWRNTPILTFEDPSGLDTTMDEALKDISSYFNVLFDARSSFVTWVNGILNNHVGCALEEFKVVYYLNNTHQVVIDRWVVWAFSKKVQRLVLDFTPPNSLYAGDDAENRCYVLNRTLCNTTISKLYLTTLCLKSVNVDTLTLNYLLDACASTLDNLCISNSQFLTTITSSASLSSLKYFMVVKCPRLETIDIRAPKLVSLTYYSGWDSILRVFNIQNASKLSSVFIYVRLEQPFLSVLRSLFNYFSHLEYLKLQWRADRNIRMVLDKFPVLANLKHLEIFVQFGYRTLDGWIPFIGACPRLEKLTLELNAWLRAVPPKNVYWDKCPLRCLKTFEIRRFHGVNLDVDIANFVIENGINLQEMIIHPSKPLNLEAPFAKLDFELPPHVKLVIVECTFLSFTA